MRTGKQEVSGWEPFTARRYELSGPRGPVLCWDRRTVTPGRRCHILSLAFTDPRIAVACLPNGSVTGFSPGTRLGLPLPWVVAREYQIRHIVFSAPDSRLNDADSFSTLQETHCLSVTETGRLMLFQEAIEFLLLFGFSRCVVWTCVVFRKYLLPPSSRTL